MKNIGWYSLQQLLKAIIPTLYGAFRSCSILSIQHYRLFRHWGPYVSFSLGRKNPNNLQEWKMQISLYSQNSGKVYFKFFSVSCYKQAWKICLGGMAVWEWPFATDCKRWLLLIVLCWWCVFCQSEKLQIVPANRRRVLFWNCLS